MASNNLRTRDTVFGLMREHRPLLYQSHGIRTFPDLPLEILSRRRALKSVASHLREAQIRFFPSGKILLFQNGAQLLASDEDSGWNLLVIDVADEMARRAPKCGTRTQAVKDTKKAQQDIFLKCLKGTMVDEGC